MGKSLVIVESPAKAGTITKFLGSGYEVKASMGHVRALPKNKIGVEEKTFKPTYQILPDKKKIVASCGACFEEAKVTGNVHMFRHTFATDLLTRGVPIEDVASLLGHATPAITAKYYSHFVRAWRERLEERVREVWA